MADRDRDRWDRYGGGGNDRYGRDRGRDFNHDTTYTNMRDRDDRDRGDHYPGGDFASAGFGGSGYGSLNRDVESGRYDRGSDFGSSTQPSYRGRGPKGFQRSDERLRELISERLADHDAIDASEIEVTVTNGEVTLVGTVDDRRTKRLAEDLAESVGGVHDVHNQLKVDRAFFTRSQTP
ncbi:MAG TPA: BON domain-containing protein [Thermoanaerobaculia bacterium]